ncbi:MAG: hypothetical protein WCP06_08165 [Verrucomicrobiota bacterium]
MIAFFLILVLSSFAALVVQHFIPPLAFLEGARVVIMPLILFYGALALPFGLMLALAFACGLMWDCLTSQVVTTGMGTGTTPTVEMALGWSILLYATLGGLMSGFRPLFQRGRWEIHCLMSGILTSLILLVEFLMISVRRAALEEAPFVFTREVWWRIGGPGLIALFIAPVLFWLLSSFAALVGYNPRSVVRMEEDE